MIITVYASVTPNGVILKVYDSYPQSDKNKEWSPASIQRSELEERQGGSTWLTEASVWATGEGERQAGGEEISLLVPSSPDSSVTGDSKVWQRPAVICHTKCSPKEIG